jgi:hypothetical protein
LVGNRGVWSERRQQMEAHPGGPFSRLRGATADPDGRPARLSGRG